MSEEETRVIKRFNPCPTKKTKEGSPKKEKSFPWGVIIWVVLLVIAVTTLIKLLPSLPTVTKTTAQPRIILGSGQTLRIPTNFRKFDIDWVTLNGADLGCKVRFLNRAGRPINENSEASLDASEYKTVDEVWMFTAYVEVTLPTGSGDTEFFVRLR